MLKAAKPILEMQGLFHVETALSVEEAIKKICEAYGWTIRETGKQGKGAQFTMIMPKTTKNGKKSYRIN